MRTLPISFILMLLPALAGCVSKSETFAGHSSQEVWTALAAVAKTPDYRDPDPTQRWTVRENDVWVDEAGHRIEILRRLERDLHNPASKPRHEDREWKLQITLASGDPPKAEFKARGWVIPAHVWDEADRYFNQVWDLLGGRPMEAKEGDNASTQPAASSSAAQGK